MKDPIWAVANFYLCQTHAQFKPPNTDSSNFSRGYLETIERWCEGTSVTPNNFPCCVQLCNNEAEWHGIIMFKLEHQPLSLPVIERSVWDAKEQPLSPLVIDSST